MNAPTSRLTAADADLLSDDELAATADAIEAQQLANGLILWFEGGHADAWNHVEAAMALTVAGRHAAAERAFDWLADTQLDFGGWHNYYTANGVSDAQFDTNCCAYIATGVWHRHRATNDGGFVADMWPTVAAALDWVVSLRNAAGHIPWAVHTDGTPWSYSLLTASSSILMSLRCGLGLAELVGCERPEWQVAADDLKRLIVHHPDTFEPKDRWAMDWYYPVLCGALTGRSARAHLAADAPRFLTDTDGAKAVRCVADKPWVTTAETCEAAFAHLRAGLTSEARALFRSTRHLRQPDGSYLTGHVLPERNSFPRDERTTYSAAAVLLAADELARSTRKLPTASTSTKPSASARR